MPREAGLQFASTNRRQIAASRSRATSTSPWSFRSAAPQHQANSSSWKTTSAYPPASATCLTKPQGDEAHLPAASFTVAACAPSSNYPRFCWQRFRSLAPEGRPEPKFVCSPRRLQLGLLRAHIHSHRQMGIDLVEGRDLLTHDNVVYMRPRRPQARRRHLPALDERLQRLAHLPRRLHPRLSRPLTLSRRQRHCDQRFGTGLADDKAIYAYVPKMIRYYLNEDPILPTSKPTCSAKRRSAVCSGQPRQAGVKAVARAADTYAHRPASTARQRERVRPTD